MSFSISRRHLIAGAAGIAVGTQAIPRMAGAAVSTAGRIAYLSSPDLLENDRAAFIANANGTNVVPLPMLGREIAWAPDGSRFALSTEDGIYSMRPDGTGQFQLHNADTTEDLRDIVFTPDGGVLFFASNRRLRLVATDGSYHGGTYLFPPSAPLQFRQDVNDDYTIVFDGPGPTSTVPSVYAAYMGEDWWSDPVELIPGAIDAEFSPDGTKLVYLDTAGGSDGRSVWIANADGTNRQQLVGAGSHSVFSPTWSPDGTQVLYVDGADKAIKKVAATPGSAGSPITVVIDRSRPAWQPLLRGDVVRTWGNLALDTAVAISRSTWADFGEPGDPREPAGAVVLSRGDQFYDALSGSALAAHKSAPLLITPPTSLYPATFAEIQRVLGSSGQVYILGGTAAIAPGIESALKAAGYTVKRLGGADMFETSISIAKEITSDPTALFIATGVEYYDALAAGAAAGSGNWGDAVVVLTNGDHMPQATINYLNSLENLREMEIIGAGGPGVRAITNAINADLIPKWKDFELDIWDCLGTDAIHTAILIAGAGFGIPPQEVAVATTSGWYDALTGGAMIGSRRGPLLLTTPSGLDSRVSRYLETNSASVSTAFILGGTAALPDTLVNQVGNRIGLSGNFDYTQVTPSWSPAQVTAKRTAITKTTTPPALRLKG